MTQEENESTEKDNGSGEDRGGAGDNFDPQGAAGFGSPLKGGKMGPMLKKIGPLLQSKEIFFSMIDDMYLPHIEETLDKYLYGKYLEHRAKYLYSYYEHLMRAGFNQKMAENLVEIQAKKEPLLKALVGTLPEIIKAGKAKKKRRRG